MECRQSVCLFVCDRAQQSYLVNSYFEVELVRRQIICVKCTVVVIVSPHFLQTVPPGHTDTLAAD